MQTRLMPASCPMSNRSGFSRPFKMPNAKSCYVDIGRKKGLTCMTGICYPMDINVISLWISLKQARTKSARIQRMSSFGLITDCRILQGMLSV